jgi:hypothetical protein
MLQFVRKIVDVAAGHSKDDLLEFRSVAEREYRSLVPVIDAYLDLSERAETDVSVAAGVSRKSKSRASSRDSADMHLFDLLRERRLFPSNSDLSEFAGRVLPNMSRRRFDKMSRGDIAARIIEYLETREPRTRQNLEASMREAMIVGPARPADRKSFLSKWEKIIKGIEL